MLRAQRRDRGTQQRRRRISDRRLAFGQLEAALNPVEAFVDAIKFGVLSRFADMEICDVTLNETDAENKRIDLFLNARQLLAHVAQVFEDKAGRLIGHVIRLTNDAVNVKNNE